MSVFKNMEVVLCLSFGLLCGLAWLGPQPSPATGNVTAVMPAAMPVVIISAKRMTVAEKQRELQASR